MAVTLPVTAQSPKETRTFVRSRMSFSWWRFSSLATAPSTRVTSTSLGNSLMSMIGL